MPFSAWLPTKTITLDIEAYEALKRKKRKGQSFSDVKEHFSAGATGSELRRALRELRLYPSSLDAMDDLVRRRGSDPATAPEL